MNKVYRVVWNKATQTWNAVQENAKAQGKSPSTGVVGSVQTGVYTAVRFVYTLVMSGVLIATGQVVYAATGATGTDAGTTTGVAGNLCYYDTGATSVICGDATTTTTNASVSSGNPAKSVVLGIGSTNTGETNVVIGSGNKTVGGASAAVVLGTSAQASGGYGVAIGYETDAARTWDISIGRQAGSGQTTTQTEGRNIAIGDGALKKAVNPNNNIAVGTDAGANMTGTANVVIGTYANSPSARQGGTAVTANDVVAIGNRALATSGSAVAIGQRTNATGNISIALGASATASANYAIAQGYATQATGISSVAIGGAQNVSNQTRATANYATAIGFAANAGASGAVAIGRQANHDIKSTAADSAGRSKTVGVDSIAIGTDTNAAATNAMSLGTGSQAAGANAIAQGTYANAGASGAIAMGVRANAENATTTKTTGANSIAIGVDTNAAATHGVAIGTNATVASTGTGSLAIGASSKVTGVNAAAVGQASEATGQNSFAGGNDTHAIGKSAVAIGDGAGKGTYVPASGTTLASGSYASGASSTAVGAYTKAAGEGSTALGMSADAQSYRSVAAGAFSVASAESAIAIGDTATAKTNTGTIAIGKNSAASGTSSVAVGTGTVSSEQSSVAVGNKANANKQNTVAIGESANAAGSGNVVIGANAGKAHSTTAQGNNTVLIGVDAGAEAANNQGQVSVGWQAGQGTLQAFNAAVGHQAGQFVNGTNNVAFGKGAGSGTSATDRLTANDTVSIGTGAKATANNGIAIGNGAKAEAVDSISIGTGNTVSGKGSGAIGDPSTVSGTGSYSLGNDNTITTNDTFVIGNDVTQTLANSVILGDSSSATAVNTGTYTLDGTQDSKVKGVTDVVGVVSVGAAGQTRQIQNVAAGVVSDTSTDAINGSQLYAVAKELKDGQTHFYSVKNSDSTAANYNNDGATADDALAAGVGASATAYRAVAIGKDAAASNIEAVAIGTRAAASNTGTVAMGQDAKALGISAAAIGLQAEAIGNQSYAMGATAKATEAQTVAIGYQTKAEGQYGTAVGNGATVGVGATHATAVGSGATASAASSLALGSGKAIGASSVAIGRASEAYTGNDIAIGSEAKAGVSGATDSSHSIAIGRGTQATTLQAVAIGNSAKVTVDNGVALGSSSVASVKQGAIGTDPLGAATSTTNSTWKATHAAVSVGSGSTITRQITNVAAGTNDTDAVNVAQLKAAGFTLAASNTGGGESTTVPNDKIQNGETVTVDAGKNIKVTHTANTVSIATKDEVEFNKVTVGGVVVDGTSNKVSGLANGDVSANSTDAINGSQLHTTNQNVANNTANIAANTTAINKGLNFGGDTGTDFNRQLGDKINVKGGSTANLTDGNIGVVGSATDNSLTIKLAEKINLGTAGSVTTGDTKVDNAGVTIESAGKTPVSLTNAGLDNGGNVISNVGAGKADTDVVNVSQLTPLATALGVNVDPNSGIVAAPSFVVTKTDGSTYAGETTIQGALDNIGTEIQKGITFAGNSGQAVKKLGETFNIKGTLDNAADASDKNIRTEVDGNGVMSIKLAENPKFGNVTINDSGKITGVTAGTADTDAVNVAQLNNKTATTPLTVGNTGAVDTLASTDANKLATAGDIANAINKAGFTLTTAKTTDGELGANSTSNELINAGDTVTVEADKNIKVTQTNGKISIATKDDVSFNNVTVGNTTIDNSGITIKTPTGGTTSDVKLTASGLDNGGNKITNVKAGTQGTDAVNFNQLTYVKNIAESKLGSFTVGADSNATATGINIDKDNTRFDIVGANNGKIVTAVDGNKVTVDLTDDAKASLTKADTAMQSIKVKANGSDVTTLDKDNNTLEITQGDNITVANDNGKVKVSLNSDVTGLNSLTSNSVTAGTGTNAVVLDDKGVNVGGKTYISDAGLNANDKKITNVANGNITSASKDAINGSQLHAVSTATKNLIGSSATVNSDGTVTASNIGGTGATTIDDAIKTVKTTVKSTDNTIKVTANPADATNGTVFDISVDAQKLAESAQLPVVYTDADGNKVYKVNGKFTKDPTGQDATQEVTATNVIASMQNADGTISPTTLANIKAGTKDTDAVNVSQLKGAVDALGGGAAINTDGTIKAPTYNITNPANGTVTTANNVGDALKGLNDAVNSPLTFKGDSGEFNRNLGQTTTVKGGITDTAKLSDNNIGVVAKDGALDIKLAKDIAVDSVKAGDTTVNTYGVSIASADPNKVVSLTASGLNNGNNRITNVAAGQAGTDAVNKDQLDKAQAAATTKVANGKNIKVAEQTNADGSKTYTVATADEVAFDKATVGGVVVDGTSNKISGLANGDVSANSTDAINGSQLFATNQNVANNAAKIADNAAQIAKGINFGGTTGSNNYALGDTINVKGDSNISSETVAGGVQLKLNDVISVGTAKPVQIDGTKGTVGGLSNTAWDANNIVSGQAATEDQLKSAVTAAQAAATTKVVEGKNVKVSEQTNADGSKTYTVATADDLDVTSIKAGDTTINNAGVTVGDKVALSNTGLTAGDVKVSTDGINAGNKVITGVAAGTKDTDAVNVKQLNDQLTATEKTTTAQAGSDKVTVTGTTTGNNTDYVIDLSKDAKASLAKADTALQNVVSTDPNLTVSKNGDTVTLDFSDVPVFAGVTAGTGANQVVLDGKGVNVGGKTYISDAGLNANNKKVSNVANGDVSATSKDAINGSQLFAQGEGVKNIIGGNTTYDPATGTYTNNNIGGTGKGNINDAIQAINTAATQAKSTVTAGDNIVVTPSQNVDGSTNYTVATAKDLTVDSIKAGDTTINNAGVTVGDKVALSNTGLTAGDVKVSTDGINAGNKVITGVASGLNGKTLDQIKADPKAAERTNAASIGDLAEVQSNVTNISNNYNTTVNQVIGGTTPDGKVTDASGNAITDNSGNAIDVSDALKTYNVSGNHAKTDNTLVTAIKNINEGGIKFFHVNDGTGEQNVTGSDVHTEDSTASGNYSAAIGYQAKSTGENAIAIGVGSSANAKNTIAIGTGNIVNGENSGAIGDPSIINGANSYSVGNNNTVATDSTFVLGNNVTQTLANSVILGDKSSATEVHTTASGGNYTFAGANDANVAGVNDVVGVVSVGTEGETRQVQNVAAGVVSADSTDAINGSQLYYTNEAIGNVANYAVNMGNQLSNRIDDVEDGANAGVSSAMAMASLPQAYIPGKSMLTGGMASYNGEGAVAVGLSKLSDNGRWVMKISGSADTKGNAGAAIGAGFHF